MDREKSRDRHEQTESNRLRERERRGEEGNRKKRDEHRQTGRQIDR